MMTCLEEPFSLRGKTAVVIGGTGELCGAMATALAGAGAEVVLVGYKVAAQMGGRYYAALREYRSDDSCNVTENLWVRHIKPLFMHQDY
jgi:NAD(P)-dependent dehydrogenase (short-subunit alcohol dehydrogenase family)